ncbi:TetR/AcrR family transcriptional regulator [Leptospira semungkisensis]|uniref:TetR/AcrR family transcriptional regulator n=1 Tax=Leptospira semungkisensis TaxID=2484985 RepID=A0A4R9G554_9LEPT|nr:TetR/AcrR family transcriptional regulator [Leptospira semungkisensis]TGK06676.1 TetR/AcrR family transcriptional regulator [Leptospira semungkisensis]
MKLAKSKPGWKKMPEEIRKTSILQAAMRCFFSKGFERTSVQDIAEAAGLTKGGIYFHFESKEEIRDTLIRNFLSWERFGFEDPEVAALPPHLRLVEYLERLAKRLAIDGNCSPRLFAEATACGAMEPEILEFYNSLERLFAKTIQEAQKNGKIHETLSPELLARTLLALFDGLQIQSDISSERDLQSKGREVLKSFFKTLLFIPSDDCQI